MTLSFQGSRLKTQGSIIRHYFCIKALIIGNCELKIVSGGNQ